MVSNYAPIVTGQMRTQISFNVRFILWTKKVPREQWHSWVLRRTSLKPDVASKLIGGRLSDDQVSIEELLEICRAFEFEGELDTFSLYDLANERTNILQENLRYLFGSLGHGGKKTLAAELEVDPTTISRWLNSSSEPTPRTLLKLVARFGLPADTDLKEVPVFLSAHPISYDDRRRWVQKRIESLSPEELQDLYPALRRMLEER